MENESQRPPVPGMGRVPNIRRVLVISLMAILLAAALGTYAFWTRFLQSFDGGKASQADIEFDIEGDFNQQEWERIQRRQFIRCGLHELDNRGELIWDDIEALQNEIDAYQKRFNDLMKSEKGKRLMEDEWVIRYAIDKWGEPLEHDRIAKHCRVRLNTLMYTVERALRKKKDAYEVSPETEQKVTKIEFEVRDALKEYTRHRILLDWLTECVAQGQLAVAPRTLEDVATAELRMRIAREFGHPLAQEASNSAESKRENVSGGGPEHVEKPTTLDSSTLLDDVDRSQSGVPDHFTDTTLGRDTVRDRDEPPRRRLGQ